MSQLSPEIKKYIPLIVVSLVAVIVLLWFALKDSNEYKAQLIMESDAMSIVNYYNPKRILLQDTPLENNIRLPQFSFPQPKFGTLFIGNGADSMVTIALDETQDKKISYLYIDKNNNEDLTDDDEPLWGDDKGTYWIQETIVDVNYRDGVDRQVPYPITFYRYKNRLENSIIAYRNGYRKGYITLKDSTYKIGLFDDDLDGLFNEPASGAIVIDLNNDDVLDGEIDSQEYFSLSSAFPVRSLSYKIKRISPSGDLIVLTTADTLITTTALLPGSEAPLFEAEDINGQTINLAEFKNKVVLIDFWATWCKPWENQLDELKRNYNRYHARGFEIIGMNLDYDLDDLREFVKEHQIDWPQISDGMGWDMPFVKIYQISALPRNFLIDRAGTIRYKDLHGKNLGSKIFELLNEPEVSD